MKFENVLNATIKDMSGREYEAYAFYVEWKNGDKNFRIYYYNSKTERIWGI